LRQPIIIRELNPCATGSERYVSSGPMGSPGSQGIDATRMNMPKLTFRLTAALLALAMSGTAPAFAQGGPGPAGKAPYSAQPPARNEAGKFDYYSMVMSWSPTHCATAGRPNDPQCSRRGDRAYSFVMHGLWPQHERGWPEMCPTRERPFVPQQTINRMLDIMPSSGLIIHEYKKHGTCSGLAPDAYFDLSRKLYTKIKVPPRYERPNQALVVSPSEIVNDFVGVNPGTKAENFAVVCNGPGNRLREVRVCFSREGEPKACGRNEEPRRLCQSNRIYVPPVRASGPAERNSQPAPADPGLNNQRGERRI
jgi:ribonuclease T2